MGDSPVMATEPEGLGFSTKRLARITSFEHVETGDLPGAVVAFTRNVKLAYLEAIGFQDCGRTIPMRPDSNLLDRVDDQTRHQRCRDNRHRG
jgi:hypothetical protein